MTKKKILVVTHKDDQLFELIEREFSDICDVVNIQEAGIGMKAAIIGHQPDCIFMDAFMPSKCSGYAGIAVELRQWTESPVFVLSTHQAGEGNVRGPDPVFEDRLGEPFSVSKLRASFIRRMNPQEAPD